MTKRNTTVEKKATYGQKQPDSQPRRKDFIFERYLSGKCS